MYHQRNIPVKQTITSSISKLTGLYVIILSSDFEIRAPAHARICATCIHLSSVYQAQIIGVRAIYVKIFIGG